MQVGNQGYQASQRNTFGESEDCVRIHLRRPGRFVEVERNSHSSKQYDVLKRTEHVGNRRLAPSSVNPYGSSYEDVEAQIQQGRNKIQESKNRIEAEKLREKEIERIERLITKFENNEHGKKAAFLLMNISPETRKVINRRIHNEVREIVSNPDFVELCLSSKKRVFKMIKITDSFVKLALELVFSGASEKQISEIMSQMEEKSLFELYPRQAAQIHTEIQRFALMCINVSVFFRPESSYMRITDQKVAAILRRSISELRGKTVSYGPHEDEPKRKRSGSDSGGGFLGLLMDAAVFGAQTVDAINNSRY